MRQHGHSSDSDSCKSDKFKLNSITFMAGGGRPNGLCLATVDNVALLERKLLGVITMAPCVMISGNAADDG